MKNRLLLIMFVLMGVFNQATAQEDTLVPSKDLYRVVKNDGAEYIGFLLKNDAREVLIRTESLGDIYIPKHEIKSIEKYNPEEEDLIEKDHERHLLPSRYIQTTSGLPVKKGEGYAKFMLVGLDLQFAITDHWSMGGMTSWAGTPIIFTTKYSHSISEKLHTSVGLLYGNLIYADFFGSGGPFSTGGGILFGNLTFGNAEANINISGGYGFTHANVEHQEQIGTDPWGVPIYSYSYVNEVEGTALFSLGAMKRITPQAVLVFDSIINFNDYSNLAFFAPAVRYMPQQTNIFQFGLGMGVIDGELIPLPMPMLSFHKIFKSN